MIPSTGTVPSGKRPPLPRVLMRMLTTLGVVAVASAILALMVGAGAGAAGANTQLPVAPSTSPVTTTLAGRDLPGWVADLLRSGRVSTAADPVLVQKDVSTTDPNLGEMITYTIWLTNNSNVTITDILIDDYLPVPVMTDSLDCDDCIKIGRALTYTQGGGDVTEGPTAVPGSSGSALEAPGSPGPAAPLPMPTSTPTPPSEASGVAPAQAAVDPIARLSEARARRLAEVTLPAAPGHAAGVGLATAGVAYSEAPRASAGLRPAPEVVGRVSAAASITASFTGAPTSGPAPLTVSFTNTSMPAASITSCVWYYGDGTDETPATPLADVSHEYADGGTYTVTLVVASATEVNTATEVSYIKVCEPVAAAFDVAPTSGPEPLTVAFTNTSTGDLSTSSWDFGDGSPASTEANPSHEYSSVGTYTVTLTVDGCGGTDSVTHTVHVCTPVDASFTHAPTTGPTPLTVVFTNTSTGDFDTSSWTFGDGSTSSTTSPTHSYNTAGTYTATLTVSGCGGTASATGSVHACAPVNAAFDAAPTSGPVPLTVAFTNASTGDFSTSSWDFGDGSPASTEANPSHEYSSVGTYTVTLTVDGCGGTDSVTHTVHVCTPVDASFTHAPTTGPTPLTVVFTNTSTGDFDTSSWTFGDGSTSSTTSPTHSYNTAGTYTATLTVSGCGGTASATGTVHACAPVNAAFSATPVTGTRPLTVSFTNNSTGDYDTILWSFGDGATSTDPNPTHTYADAGSYTVSLNVEGCGGSDTETKSGYIHAYEPPVALFSASPKRGEAPLTVTFTNSSTGDWDNSLWDFGDGSTSTSDNPTHTYADNGMYDVSLTVDGLGGTDTRTEPYFIRVFPVNITSWVVEELQWQLDAPLGPGEGISVTFSMPVVGLADGSLLRNRGFVQYRPEGGTLRAAMSAPADATVHVPLRVDGAAQLVAQPTWIMPASLGVMNSQSWEDMDSDGDLDLAVAGENGPAVYRNIGGGQFEFCWTDAEHKGLNQKVIWADLDNDSHPELIAVGSTGVGVYVYAPDGSGFTLRQALPKPFAWYGNLSSVAAADTDNDGDLDLVAGSGVDSSTFWTAHPSRAAVLYQNDGTGKLGAPVVTGDPAVVAQGYYYPTSHDVAVADANNDGVTDVALTENSRYPVMDSMTICVPVVHCTKHCILWYCWEDCSTEFVCYELPAGYHWEDKSWATVGTLGPVTTPGTWTGLGSALGQQQLGFDGPFGSDLSWGDYNGDGYLDLGVAYENEPYETSGWYHILKNAAGSLSFPDASPATLITATGMSRALDWGDYNGDGRLELAVGGRPPMVLRWTGSGDQFESTPLWSSAADLAGIIGDNDVAFEMHWVDYDNDGDLDLALTSNSQPVAVFANYAPFLSADAAFVGTWPANSVAWGDVNGDGDLDLLLGAAESEVGARLLRNVNGSFAQDRQTVFSSGGFGPLDVAWGDANGDGKLEMAVTQETGWRTLIYTDTSTDSGPAWDVDMGAGGSQLAWGFRNWMPGGLDLLVAGSGGVQLYPYDRATNLPSQMPSVITGTSATGAGWADFDADGYLDIAAIVDGLPQVYRNLHDGSFAPVDVDNSLIQADKNASTLAWADYDGDGREELAVACNPGVILIYKYDAATETFAVAWQSAESRHTTSLDWGDWDSDGDLDLAVGNDGEADEVYLNLTQQNGSSPLVLLWKSAEALHTTDVAWGDMDGDGDLDLAVSSHSGARIYENNYVRPSHLTERFARTMPLPNNPSYLSIARPGSTAAAYGYSSAEILPRSVTEPVAIQYTLYDPDGTRDESVSNAVGDPVLDTRYEYSLDGGATWKTATPAASWAGQTVTTTRLGEPATFLWDAVADAAVSEDARFRITIVNSSKTGFKQRATTSAVSPPFRVRGTSCVWPEYPWILASPENPDPNQSVSFTGLVERASGVLTFTWDFGDGTPPQTTVASSPTMRLAGRQAEGLSADWRYGQQTTHTYTETGVYTVTLTVQGEACPVTRSSQAVLPLTVGTSLDRKTWLPLVLR